MDFEVLWTVVRAIFNLIGIIAAILVYIGTRADKEEIKRLKERIRELEGTY